MSLRPWLQSVRKVLGTSSRGHSRRRMQTTPCAAQMETLEGRQLLAASPIRIENRVLMIDGTAQSDDVKVTQSDNIVTVTMTTGTTILSKTYNKSSFDKISFSGNNGDDKFDNKTSLNVDSTLNGGAGNDTLKGGFGNDLIDGGANDDTIDGRNRKDTLKGGSGNDLIEGGDDLAADELHGGTGNDTLKGQGGADSLYGNGDDDTLKGGDGDDLLQGGGGVDECDGGDGDGDTLLAEIGSGEDYDLILTNTRLNENVLKGIEKAELVGNSKANRLDAGGFTKGSVTIRGGAGNDTLIGGSRDDELSGGDGNDRLTGGKGDDSLSGGKGNDTLDGGKGNDELAGGAGQDRIIDDRRNAPSVAAQQSNAFAEEIHQFVQSLSEDERNELRTAFQANLSGSSGLGLYSWNDFVDDVSEGFDRVVDLHVNVIRSVLEASESLVTEFGGDVATLANRLGSAHNVGEVGEALGLFVRDLGASAAYIVVDAAVDLTGNILGAVLGRHLTNAEKSFAKGIFGNERFSYELETLYIHFGTLNDAQRPHVFGSVIFLTTNDPLATKEGRQAFAHELTHVFQDSQLLVQDTGDAVRGQYQNEIGQDPYKLDLTTRTLWSLLGAEQQGIAVEFWQKTQIDDGKVDKDGDGDKEYLTDVEIKVLQSLMQQAELFEWRP